MEGRESVFVIGATNRPDMIDPAMLRPGRLDKLLYVPLPSTSQRVSILKTIGRKFPVDATVDFTLLGSDVRLEGFSGADLAAVLREASLTALKLVYSSKSKSELEEFERFTASILDKDDGTTDNNNNSSSITEHQNSGLTDLPTIQTQHFDVALAKVKPSVSSIDRLQYEQFHRELHDDDVVRG